MSRSWMMVSVVMLAVALGYGSDRWYEQRLIHHARTEAAVSLAHFETIISAALEQRLVLLSALKALVLTDKRPEAIKRNFDVYAPVLFEEVEGIRNFSLAPVGVQQYVYPLEGNEGVVGHDLINDSRPQVRADVRRAMQSEQVVLSGPYELRQGGMGLVSRLAIFDRGEFWGLAVLVIDLPPIFEEGFRHDGDLDGLSLAVRQTEGPVFFGRKDVFESDPVVLEMHLPDGGWEMAVIPAHGWYEVIRANQRMFRLLGGGMLVTAVVLLLLYIRHFGALTLRFKAQQEELSRSKEGLQHALSRAQKWERVIEDARWGVVVALPAALMFEMMNPKYAQMHGYTVDELMALPIETVFPTELRQEFRRHVTLSNERQQYSFELDHIRKDGTRFPVYHNVSVVRDEEDKPLYRVVYSQDITRIRAAESAREASLAMLAKVLDSLDAIVYVSDMETDELLFVNKYTRDIFGDVVGQTCWRALQSGQSGRCEFCTNHLLLDEQGQPRSAHQWEFQNTVNKRWYLCRDKAIIWINGRMARMEIASDITEIKDVERALLDQDALLRALIEQSPVPMAVATKDGVLRFINDACRKHHGMIEGDGIVVGANLFEIKPTWQNLTPQGAALPLDQMPLAQALQGKIVRGREIKVIRRDGTERWELADGVPIYDQDGALIAGFVVFTDITDITTTSLELDRLLSIKQAVSELSTALLRESSLEDIAHITLGYSRDLTQSEHGYASVIDPASGDNVGYTLTRMMGETCEIQGEDKLISFPMKDGRYAKLWGFSLNTRQPMFTNDPSAHESAGGLPEGHVPLERFLSVPAIYGGELVGQIALSNPPRDYTEQDLATVGRLADIFAIAIHRSRVENQILESLGEKEVLIREIHHRVKNNMAVITALLSLQSSYVQDERYRSMFVESQSRIRSMALVHEMLYQTDDFTDIDVTEYIRSLVRHVRGTIAPTNDVQVTLNLPQSVRLDIDSLVPLGLIMNEILTNSWKHAFTAQSPARPEITIDLSAADNRRITLRVGDNGVGIAEDVWRGGGLGMKLIRTLCGQINATFEVKGQGGTHYIITFEPKVAMARPISRGEGKKGNHGTNTDR